MRVLSGLTRLAIRRCLCSLCGTQFILKIKDVMKTMAMGSDHIKKAISIVVNQKNRPRDCHGNAGGLVDIAHLDKPVLVVGDLHGAVDNLRQILEDDNNKENLLNSKLILVIIGDGVHNDQTGQMKEMESSYQVLEEVFRLINTYKDSVIYIRGNHDTFDERLSKSGIKQGYEFKRYLTDLCGEEYVSATNEFFDSLPLFIIGKGFVITHAGPIRHGATRQELIDIADNSDYQRQLMWNRIHEFRGTPSLKEYGAADIVRMLELLKLPADTYFIVGHNPMWHTGNKTGIWADVLGIKNHYIVYTNIGTRGPYLRIEKQKLTARFALPKQPERVYV